MILNVLKAGDPRYSSAIAEKGVAPASLRTTLSAGPSDLSIMFIGI